MRDATRTCMQRFSALALVVTISGCDGKSAGEGDGKPGQTPEAGADPAVADPATPVATPTPSTAEAKDGGLASGDEGTARKHVKQLDAAGLAEVKKNLRAELDEGRKDVKAGKLDDGIAHYEALLRIDPHYGRALGELGWAYFKKGELDRASTYTKRALADAEDPKRRGMLLYNLGRIAEKRDEKDAAIDAYAASLLARPNDVVQGRYDELTGGAKPPPAAKPTAAGAVPGGMKPLATGLATIEDACKVAKEAEWYGDTCELIGQSPDGHWGMLHGYDLFFGCYYPVAKRADGWAVFGAVTIEESGSEVSDVITGVTTKVVGTGENAIAIITFEKYLEERDWEAQMDAIDNDGEYPALASTGLTASLYCGAPQGKVVCSLPLMSKYEFQDGLEARARYEGTLTVDGTDLVVANVKKSGPLKPPKAMSAEFDEYIGFDVETWLDAGRYPLADLWR